MTEDEYRRKATILANAKQYGALKKLAGVYKQSQPVDYKPMESVRNFLPSLGGVVSDIGSAVMSPIDTGKAVLNLGNSALSNAGQMMQDALPESVVSNMNRLENTLTGRELPTENAKDYQRPNQEAGEAFAGMLDDRYGSMDALKTTAMEDPAGVLLDLSSILTGGGGAAVKVGGKVGAMGQKVADVGRFIDPITGAVKAPVAAIEKFTGKPISTYLYESAMKPSTTLTPDARKNLLETAMDLNARPNVKSVEKLKRQQQGVFDEISEIENSAGAKAFGDFVDNSELFTGIPEVAAKYAPPSTTARADLNSIAKVMQDQLDSIEAMGIPGSRLSIDDLTKIKRNIYEKVKFDEGQLAGRMDRPTERTYKAIARAAKEQLEIYIPEVKELNKLYGDIAQVQKKLQIPASNRIGNRDVIGIGAPIKAGAGAAASGSVGTAAGVLAGLMDTPSIKASLGINARRAGKVVRDPATSGILRATALAGRYEQYQEAVLADKEERRRERELKEAQRKDRP
tara:strand:+ start:932 stop:2470 length:1539 start_codon:yes stop_codon:yes gene_type:complete